MMTAKTPSGLSRRFHKLRWMTLAALGLGFSAGLIQAQSENHPETVKVVVDTPANGSSVMFGDPMPSVWIQGRVIGPVGLIIDEYRFIINGQTYFLEGDDDDDEEEGNGEIPFEMLFVPPYPGQYEIVAEVETEGGPVSSMPVTLFVAGVHMDIPLSGSTIPAGSTVAVRGDAYSPDGVPVQGVEYFADGVSIGVAEHFPYTVFWTAPETTTIDSIDLSATATYSDGSAADSNIHQVQVVPRVGEPPSVEIVSPTNGEKFSDLGIGEGIIIRAEAGASGAGGSLESVEFFVNGRSVETLVRAPLEIEWTPLFAGGYTLHALAKDDKGNTTLSEPVHIIDTRERRPAEVDRDYVEFVYSFLLGRFPDSREVNDAVDALETGELTRPGLVLQQMEDPRFRALVDVWAAYDVVLGRFPETLAEIDSGVERIRESSLGLRNLVLDLLGSAEFVAKFGEYLGMSSREFVRTLYLNTGRTPTSSQLSSGEKELTKVTRSEYTVAFLRKVSDQRNALYESGALSFALRGSVPSEAETADLASLSRLDRVVLLLDEEGLSQNVGSFGGWLGSFDDTHFDYFSESGWIRHSEHGWWYRPMNGGSWVWDHIMQDWLWTNAEVYPFVYSNNNGHWYFYEQGGTPGKRAFFDYRDSVNDWVIIEK